MSLVSRHTPSRASAGGDGSAERQPLAERVRTTCESLILTSAACLVAYAARRAARLRRPLGNVLSDRARMTAERLFAAVHDTADCAFIADRDGVIEYMNPAFADLMGYSTAEVPANRPRMFPSHVGDAELFSE